MVGLLSGLAGWFVALLVLLFGSLVLMAVALSVLRRERESARRQGWALANLREYVGRLGKADAEIVLWRDEISVARNGDATWRGIQEYQVHGGSPLHFVEVTQAGEPLSKRQTRRMDFDVQLRAGGSRLPLEVIWESDKEVRLWVHLPEPVQPGSGFTVEWTYTWPRQLPMLGRNGTEYLEWVIVKFPVRRFEFEVILDTSFRRQRALGHSKRGLAADPDQEPRGGAWRVWGYEENVRPGHRIALTLDAR